ncbi:hypothetical protein XELAEV_18016662mg [Xenopus laevis]|uniref:Ataxin-10 domain-containing protein n=1 Tax=Xenopus laevis TaxID=8355 RepID=A0A974DCD8_XENLA|nr:hypothetical protein XELAEV_18016662mg [Xenopus laevis]
MAAPVERVARACSELEKLLGEDSGNGEVGLEGEVIIRRLTDMFREETYRELAEERIFRLILQTLSRVSREIKAVSSPAGAFTESRCQFSAECFRCLRNACVQCVRNQDNVRNVGLIEESVRFIRIFSDPRVLQEPALVAFRCGLQFLGNAAAGNRDSQNAIWACAFPDIFSNCLMHNDEKVVIYSSMVLFTCISRENRSALQDPSNIAVALNVITAYRKYPDAEWIYLIVVEHLLLCPDLVESMYLSQSSQDRVSLLELILAKISQKDPHPDEDAEKLQVIATFLSNCFQTQCKTILKLTSPSACDEQETFVVIRLLDILCEMTSKNEYLSCLQTCPGLLESTYFDLYPAAKHVHQLDGIALILDNCSIDDNNPCILIYPASAKNIVMLKTMKTRVLSTGPGSCSRASLKVSFAT